MILTSDNVHKIAVDCLYSQIETERSNSLKVEGIVHTFGFNPERIEAHKSEIKELLLQLPKEFLQNSGGGYSFLCAAQDKDGNQWGEQPDAEVLMCLGIAAGYVEYNVPRKFWSMLPGSVPYFVIRENNSER